MWLGRCYEASSDIRLNSLNQRKHSKRRDLRKNWVSVQLTRDKSSLSKRRNLSGRDRWKKMKTRRENCVNSKEIDDYREETEVWRDAAKGWRLEERERWQYTWSETISQHQRKPRTVYSISKCRTIWLVVCISVCVVCLSSPLCLALSVFRRFFLLYVLRV